MLPGLGIEVTSVSTEPTNIPTAAVLTHVLYQLMYTYCGMNVPTVAAKVPTVRTRTIPTAVQYVLRNDIRTNCTADTRTYILVC